ncbi:protein turtle homolog B-like [Homarus americanus]|uniref:protein turtle homolog B-like n=1 Tax=Homarus americanus TaxID=6706 RepID=UPI001C44C39E|nr:protein turtle homolog B-like [Homarus americanus]XP_042203661.1 protein turtle homolog B-like [Homarus americanus]XP_042203662.1 protein turtle homolog B-like [Homarus americanus]
MKTHLQVTVLFLLVVVGREILAASLPVLPSLLPPSTTLLGPAEETAAPPAGSSPVFTQQNNTENRAQVGTTAVLHCLAHNVGENMVSWIRRRDYHLLTVGSQTYSSDSRFQVRYIKQDNDWQLHIRYVQVRDDGVYECQVSSHPPVSLLSTLHVLEATSEILGGPEKYMTVGSSLRLVCVLRDNTQPPTYVFWYHNHHMINYHATREVRVENNRGLSVLFLSNVRPADSGNYTCAPSNARPAHIHIQVLKGGETPAAIHSSAGIHTTSLPLLLTLLICVASRYLPQASNTKNRTGEHRAGLGRDGITVSHTHVRCQRLAWCTPYVLTHHGSRTPPPGGRLQLQEEYGDVPSRRGCVVGFRHS